MCDGCMGILVCEGGFLISFWVKTTDVFLVIFIFCLDVGL